MDVRTRGQIIVLCAVAALMLAACGGDGVTDEPAAERPDETVSPAVLAQPAATARTLVAAEAGVDAEEVEIVTAEQVTWRSGALGCPDPDQVYTQALVEGYRIVLEAGGETYFAHGATGEPPFLCEDPEEPARTGTSDDGY